MSAGPFAVGGWPPVPSVYIAGESRGVALLGDRVAQGVGGRLAAPWFRIHPAERRVGQPVPAKSGALPLPLAIAFTRSNGA
jgi:hypothetical protein